ncbi:hypothetical protein [Saccharomonospora iraqiensis]|uniref:hypothetical protein n=1 Tax=Saccharomonospora iraqiensis TaxID=52698 RepID=UPI0006889BAA|nr:hypothetical protein [Saccharomonospora iraqiensis]
METAISVPDATSERVEQRATASADLEGPDRAEEIDEALARIEGDDSGAAAVQAGHRHLAGALGITPADQP